MAKCPKCGEEITELNNVQSGVAVYKMTVENGEVKYGEMEFTTDFGPSYWECPHCQEILTYKENEAQKILEDQTL
jgi:transcription initiation factor IIE alpha subunit